MGSLDVDADGAADSTTPELGGEPDVAPLPPAVLAPVGVAGCLAGFAQGMTVCGGYLVLFKLTDFALNPRRGIHDGGNRRVGGETGQ